MKFTFKWLQEYLGNEIKLTDILTTLPKIGFEVESVEDQSLKYEPFIIAQIIDCHPHPEADKLNVCKVNIRGSEPLQIVCGAPNARAGIKVVLAPIGSTIPSNKLVIKASKIRGVESQGMLCSKRELELGMEDGGIIELPDHAIIGEKFSSYANLDDAIIEIAITPNRGDAISVYGIARDLAAAGIGNLITLPKYDLVSTTSTKKSVEILSPLDCYEFCYREIYNVDNTLKNSAIEKKLEFLGMPSKTGLVDISNYSMISYGRPNHFFDLDKIDGDIKIRRAEIGEVFVALGGEKYTLTQDNLVIADARKVLALAGIMGGELSKVDENTKNILIELANFNPVTITYSGRKVAINTDGRYRFERRVDAANSKFFMDFLTNLIITNQAGSNYTKITTISTTPPIYPDKVSFSQEYFNKLSGLKIDGEKATQILQKLGFVYKDEVVEIPSYRLGDIIGSADIVEEILRINGYENIPSHPISLSDKEVLGLKESIGDKIKTTMLGRGFFEQITWSFCSSKAVSTFRSDEQVFKIANPISQELSIMRFSALPNLLEIIANNAARSFNNLALFEIGANYSPKFSLNQTSVLTAIRAGNIVEKSPLDGSRRVDFYDIKADLFAVITKLGLNPDNLRITKEVAPHLHPGKSAHFFLGNILIAAIGELHPKILKAYDLKNNVYVLELYIDNLPPQKNKHARPKFEVSDYQSVSRDFAFIVDADIEAGSIKKLIIDIDKNLIQEVNIFDIYQGEKIEKGKKSIALSVRLQSKSKTLNEAEINNLSNNIISKMELKFASQLRG